MYLVLNRPWAGHVAAPADAPQIVLAPADAGAPTKPKKGKRRHPPGGATPVAPGSDDSGPEETEPPPLTEADRRLEWRGDEVSQPTQNLDMTAGGKESRPLDDGEIQSTISSQANGVRDCVVQGATGTDLRATITVKLLVDGTGRITRSRLQAPHYMLEHGLYPCTQRALGHMHFPATGGTTVVTLPVNLG
jgi:hypothetical protein